MLKFIKNTNVTQYDPKLVANAATFLGFCTLQWRKTPIKPKKKGGLQGGYYINQYSYIQIIQYSMKNKKRIDTYSTVYDIDLVVANKYVKLEDLKEIYTYGDGTELDDAILDGCATTATCRHKVTDAAVLLVKYNRNIRRKDIDKFLDTVDTAVHEAMHVLMHMYQDCNVNIQYDNQEPVCYDAGKITANILKTILDR